jgi:hypothetical protein
MAADPEVGHAANAIANNDAPRSSSQRNRPLSKKARENEANKDLCEDTTTAGTENSKRITRSAAAKTTPPGDGGSATPGDVVEWRQVVEVMGIVCNEVKSLREIVIKQQDAINDLRIQHEETRSELRALKTLMTEELKQVHDRLDTIGNNSALNNYVNDSPNRSYADVARTPPNSVPANVHSISSMGTTPSTMTDTLYCTVDTSRVASEDAEKVSVGAIRANVEKDIRNTSEQANWRCRAVTKDQKNPHRVRIACRDEAEHKEVKRVMEANLVTGMRILRDDLYPIRVDGVNRTAVLDEAGDIRTGAAEAFGMENETQVAKIVWLSRRDVAKAYGSMLVYLNKGADARRLLQEGFFHAGGESGYTKPFERRERPKQCYNCQEITSHMAYQCTKPQVCGRCAKEGHRHTECTETLLKCVPCGGPHESFSKHCQKLYPSHHE